MKIKVYFKGFLKGYWIFDFLNKEKFNEYLNSNRKNIKKFEIL